MKKLSNYDWKFQKEIEMRKNRQLKEELDALKNG